MRPAMRTLVRRLWVVGVGAALFVSSIAAARGDRLERHMKVLGIVLESTTLTASQRVLGKAEVKHNGGDAGAAASAECYTGPDGTTLSLMSDAEAGGPRGVITNYQLVRDERLVVYTSDSRYMVPPEKRPRCSPLKRLSRSSSSDGGLKLGMTPQEVERMLGPPAESATGYLVFTSMQKKRMTTEQVRRFAELGSHEDFFTLQRTIRVLLSDGKVVGILAWQGSST